MTPYISMNAGFLLTLFITVFVTARGLVGSRSKIVQVLCIALHLGAFLLLAHVIWLVYLTAKG